VAAEIQTDEHRQQQQRVLRMGVARSRHPESRKKTAAAATPAAASKARRAPRGGASSSSVDGKPLDFVIPSDPAATRDVQKQVMDRVEAFGYDEQHLFAIRLALEEGMMNAIKHGNKLDKRKTVHVQAKVTPKRTEITIEDQGPGFNRSSVPDPCTEANLLKCSGRGILLMEAYMDTVQYTRGGRRVKMVKKNQG
jgi:serine/threonine-protein kinase RsbW